MNTYSTILCVDSARLWLHTLSNIIPFQNEQNTQQFVSGRSKKSGYVQLEVSDLDGTFKLIGSKIVLIYQD